MRSDLRTRCVAAASRRAALPLLVALAAACGSRTPPALPAVLQYPEFVYPAVPPALQRTPGAERIDLGWRYLQNDDLGNAAREFAAAARRAPGLYPARAGEGYVALARGDYDRAVTAFDAALMASRDYVPALVGRGQSLLALKRDAEALAAFEAALAADESLANVRRRVEVLRFRNVQELIEGARRAAAAGRVADARLAYERALAATPESAFLHRELGLLERQQRNGDAALLHLRRAAELDPGDPLPYVQIGEILEERGDFAGAEASYSAAAALEPTPELAAKLAAVAASAREARLPPEFRAIPAAEQITRGELAALIGVRFESLLAQAPPRQAVATDTRGHWAAAWIAQVMRAGVIEPFENHTFQPRARVRRGDLATAASRLLTLLAGRTPGLREKLSQQPRIADMNRGHLNYPAAAAAVSAGVMPLLEGDRFQVSRAVSGAEAVEVIGRLRALAGS